MGGDEDAAAAVGDSKDEKREVEETTESLTDPESRFDIPLAAQSLVDVSVQVSASEPSGDVEFDLACAATHTSRAHTGPVYGDYSYS